MTDEKDFTAEMKRLIQEIENLRENMEIMQAVGEYQIDSLTKERDALQKEVDGDNEDLERMFALKASKVIELEAKNAELNEKNLNNINEKEAK